MTTKTDAIVTGTVDVGEASRIVRLLTPDGGRISAIAKGARGASSKLASALEPGTRLSATLVQGRGELAYLRGVDVIAAPRRARTDLDRLLLLAYGCEFCSVLAPEHHEADKLHGLLAVFLARLEVDPLPGDATRQALEAKALTFAGLAPALVRCARCQDPLVDPCVFDADAGGALHSRCGGGAPFHAADGARLDALRRTPIAASEEVGAASPRWILADFARWHHYGAPKARSVLESIGRSSQAT